MSENAARLREYTPRMSEIDRDFAGAIQVAADGLRAEGLTAPEIVEWLSAAVGEDDYLGELCIDHTEDAPGWFR